MTELHVTNGDAVPGAVAAAAGVRRDDVLVRRDADSRRVVIR